MLYYYFVPIVYVVPAITAFYIGLILRGKSRQNVKGINYIRLFYYLCMAEGLHNSYYFIAASARIFDKGIYESMMMPLPWLFAQGIITITFLMFGLYFIRNRDIEIGDIRHITETADLFRELAYIDPLTNLNNRRSLEDIMEKEKKRAARVFRPFTLMMLDMDGFKIYNDSHGHQLGDRLLSGVADVIKKNLRVELDIPFRYGGDEFFIILPETILGEAREIGERLNNSVKSISDGRITLSIGLLEISPECRMNTDEMIRLVDIIMYSAKKAGGNRVSSLAA
ncbi:MAG: GGDEF domain-containing protein [Nitrospirota bacterium]